MSDTSVSIVVPVYNSEGTLAELLARLQAVLTRRHAPFEIILVNDGSNDRSGEVVERLSRRWPHVRGIDLMRNFGQHNALLCGIRRARHEVIVTLDDDLQHPPEEIPLLLAKLAEGHDVVYGTPRQRRHCWWRDGASVLLKQALRHGMGVPTAPDVGAFRAFRTALREGFRGYRSPLVSIDVLLAWTTTRFAAVPVEHHERRLGKSNYTLRALLVFAVNLTTGFSTLPLRLASLLGFVATFLGVVVLLHVVICYLLQGCAVPGFPFLASIIAIFSGTQLFSLGIIGEYLGRMYLRLLDQPTYVIRNSREDWHNDHRTRCPRHARRASPAAQSPTDRNG